MSSSRALAMSKLLRVNNSTWPPLRLAGLRAPLATTRSLPRPGVKIVNSRSASPRSARRKIIASVRYSRSCGITHLAPAGNE